MRIGLGTDIHALEPGDGLHLGGVRIPCAYRARAHSDGDALLHAFVDAIYGALALGDIGEHFPDAADANHGRDSGEFLLEALKSMRNLGFRLGNVDTVIHLQRPKLSGYKLPIRRHLATLCEVPEALISVKAKSGEGIGPVGRCEAVSTQAVVLLVPEAD